MVRTQASLKPISVHMGEGNWYKANGCNGSYLREKSNKPAFRTSLAVGSLRRPINRKKRSF